MDNRPIGVFDSGIGGLTVVDALASALPNESVVYVGDTARVPYGNKSQQMVQQFSLEISNWLLAKDCKCIVVACNTASSLALDYLSSKFNVPVIGVIRPGVSAAIEKTSNQHVGVLGTYATVNSDAYGQQLKKINSNMTVSSQACPLFVPLVEEGWTSGSVPLSIAKTYLKPMNESDVDTVILGCTHYPILKPVIQDVLGEHVTLVDSGFATSSAVHKILDNQNMLSKNTQSTLKCFVTDSPQSFEALASRFMSAKIESISHIELT